MPLYALYYAFLSSNSIFFCSYALKSNYFRIFATEDDERTASCQKETVDYDSIYTQSVRGCFGVVAPNHVAFLRRSQVYGACM
jgi:hypothetical protein